MPIREPKKLFKNDTKRQTNNQISIIKKAQQKRSKKSRENNLK